MIGLTQRAQVASALSVFIYIGFGLLVILSALTRPVANWDILAYQAAVLDRGDAISAADLHREAYARVARHISAQDYRAFTEGDRYRIAMASDPEGFRSMLPMYQVKAGYIVLLKAASAVADPITAARMISLISVVAILAMTGWMALHLGAVPQLGLMVPVLAALKIPDMASLVTPDAPATACALAAVVLLIRRFDRLDARACLITAALVMLSVVLRPDMVVLAVGLPVAVVAGHGLAQGIAGRAPLAAIRTAFKAFPGALLAIPLAGMLAYGATKIGVTHPGWWPHFRFSIIEQVVSMTGPHAPFTWKDYLTGTVRAILRGGRDEVWPWLVLAFGLVLMQRPVRRAASALTITLFLLVLGILAVRMVMFPLFDARLAVLPVLILAFASASLLSDERSQADAIREG